MTSFEDFELFIKFIESSSFYKNGLIMYQSSDRGVTRIPPSSIDVVVYSNISLKDVEILEENFSRFYETGKPYIILSSVYSEYMLRWANIFYEEKNKKFIKNRYGHPQDITNQFIIFKNKHRMAQEMLR